MGSGERGLKYYSELLRQRVVMDNGGFTVVGEIIGESRQQVRYWIQQGVPVTRCGEVAVFLFNDFEQRWCFNFEKIYDYEKWRSKNNNLLKIWKKVISQAPIGSESKKLLLNYKE